MVLWNVNQDFTKKILIHISMNKKLFALLFLLLSGCSYQHYLYLKSSKKRTVTIRYNSGKTFTQLHYFGDHIKPKSILYSLKDSLEIEIDSGTIVQLARFNSLDNLYINEIRVGARRILFYDTLFRTKTITTKYQLGLGMRHTLDLDKF